MTTAAEGSPPPADPLARMEELGRALNEVAANLATEREAWQKVAAEGRKTRHLTIGLAVSIVFDVVLTVVIAILTVNALDQGSTLHASQLASCSISNTTRVEQQQLWVYLFQLSGPPKTAQAKAQEQKFLAYVDKTFAPVNCAQVYRK